MDEDNQAPISSNVQTNQNAIPAFVDNITSQFIVTPLTPYTVGVSGFVFDIIGNEELVLDSDITDHWIESNIAIQDQIALRPEQFTLSGYTGEIALDFPPIFSNILTALSVLTPVPGIGPIFAIQDQQAYNAIATVVNQEQTIVNDAENLYGLFTGYSTTATKQQNAFQYFYNLWLSRTLCEVETPWGVLQNMAILSVRARQDETTRTISDFSVTFKSIRFAQTSTTTSTGADLSTTAGRSTQVLQGTENATNNGTIGGVATNNSILTQTAANLTDNA